MKEATESCLELARQYVAQAVLFYKKALEYEGLDKDSEEAHKIKAELFQIEVVKPEVVKSEVVSK